jgi:hypothetical protein
MNMSKDNEQYAMESEAYNGHSRTMRTTDDRSIFMLTALYSIIRGGGHNKQLSVINRNSN